MSMIERARSKYSSSFVAWSAALLASLVGGSLLRSAVAHAQADAGCDQRDSGGKRDERDGAHERRSGVGHLDHVPRMGAGSSLDTR
jgi:hypothetical protein